VSAPPSEFAVVGDEPIDGLAQRVEQLEGVDDEEAAARLEPGVSADGLPVGTERGLRDTLQRAVARVRDRRLVEDLGEASSSFEILGLHVPTGGRAAIDLGQSTATERQLSFKLFGFGFGSGRSVEVEMNEGIAERDSCMRVVQHVVVHVRRFEAEDELVTSDIVGVGQREFVAWPDCPHCRADAEPDPFEFDVQTDQADGLDLRGYDAEVRREHMVRLEGVRKTEVGLDLPLPTGGAATAGFHLEQRTSVVCTVAYTFPPGRRFLPYRRPGDTAALPYWHTS
jgi:hypothetical protein